MPRTWFFKLWVIAMLLATLKIAPAQAANIYWDGTGTSWNTAANWSTASGAAIPDPASPPGASDIATFNTTVVNSAQTVNLNAAQSALGLVFNSAGTTTIQSGVGTNTLSIGAAGILSDVNAGVDTISSKISLTANQGWLINSPNSFTVSGDVANGGNRLSVTPVNGTVHISGVISGTGGLAKNGSGTLSLEGGTSNTFSGDTTVNDGNLTLNKAINTQAIGGNLIVGDGNGAAGSATVTWANSYQLPGNGACAVTVNADGALLLGNNVDIFGPLTMTGSTISTNQFMYFGGDVTTHASANTATVTAGAGITLYNNSGTRKFTIEDGSAAIDMAINAVISDNFLGASNAIEKAGPGTLLLSGANLFSGGLKLSAGTIAIGNDAALGTGTLTANGGAIQADTNPRTLSNAVNLTSNLTVSGNVALALNGVISGAGGLIKNGTGTLTLGGAVANTFAGPVTVNDGTVVLAKPQNVAAASSLTIGDGIGAAGSAVARIDNPYQLTYPSAIAIMPDGILTFGPNGTDEINGLTMTGGKVDTSAANGYVFLGANVTTLASSSTATIVTGNVPIAIFGSNSSGSGTSQVTFNVAKGTTSSGIDLDLPANFVNYQNESITIIKSGLGTMRMSGGSTPFGNQFSGGVTISAGTIAIGNDAALGTGTLTANGGAIQADTTPHTLSNAVNLTSNLTVKGGVDLTLTGVISGTAGLTKNGIGTLTISGANTFNGPLTINDGALTLSGGSLTANVINNATFTYNAGTFSGRLINAGTLVLNADFTAGNGMENDTDMNIVAGRRITLNGAGLDNEGTMNFYASTLQMSTSGAADNKNRGTIDFVSGVPLNLNGATLTNNGLFALNSNLVSGAGSTLINGVGGTLLGSGTITSSFSNSGGLMDVNNGTMNITQAFVNSGAIQLTAVSSDLVGGAVTNTGTINGFGSVGNSVINITGGTIEPLGGVLYLSGTLQNQAGGTIRANSGNKLLVTAGLASNPGQIALIGGTFDNNGHALNNTGQISGYGTLATGGLTNNNLISVGGGNMDVLGTVTNNGTVSVQSGRFVNFFNDVNGNGQYTGAGTAVYLAGFSPGNSPAAVSFGGNVDLTSSAKLQIELGGTTVGSQYDKVIVAGQLNLGGTLDVVLYNGFKPVAGNSFDISDWGSRSGLFDTVSLPTLGGRIVWDSSHLYDSGALGGTLSVVATYYAGDFNHDGHVNASDIALAMAALADFQGFKATTGITDPALLSLIDDVNGDGIFSNADLQYLLNVLKTGGGSGGSVPEPASLVLLGLGGLAIAFRRYIRCQI